MLNDINLNVDRTAITFLGLVGLAGVLGLMARRNDGKAILPTYQASGLPRYRRLPIRLDECQCPEPCALDHEHD